MRTIAAAMILAMSMPVLAGPFDFTVKSRLRGFETPSDIAQACTLAVATSGVVPAADPKSVLDWCMTIALEIWKNYPVSQRLCSETCQMCKPPQPQPEPAPEPEPEPEPEPVPDSATG